MQLLIDGGFSGKMTEPNNGVMFQLFLDPKDFFRNVLQKKKSPPKRDVKYVVSMDLSIP